MRERRPAVAHLNYLEHRDRISERDLAGTFRYIYETNLWGSPESRSGLGSALSATEPLRQALPALLRELCVRRLLDIPCGDFAWLNQIWLSQTGLGLESYVGGDIVREIVERNAETYATPARRFEVLDLTLGELPPADLVLCRDCLVHFSFANIFRAIRNLKRSASRYLLTTTFPEQEENQEIEDGDWRPLDLVKPPFCFPQPLRVLVEGCTEADGAYAGKALGLWRISDLPEQAGRNDARGPARG